MWPITHPDREALGASWKVAIATQDGLNVDADFESAASFALFDVDAVGARFVGLIGCFTSKPGSASRAAALEGCQVLLSLAAGSGRHRSPLRTRVVELAGPIPISHALASLRSCRTGLVEVATNTSYL